MGDENQAQGVWWRIVILLFALAGLAEQAARAPRSKRSRALAFIYSGELAAFGLLADQLPDYGEKPRAAPIPSPDAPPHQQGDLASAAQGDASARVAGWELDPALIDDSPQSALLLAARLRALGWMIAHLALAASPDDERGKPRLTSGLRALRASSLIVVPAHGEAGLRPAYMDTS